MRFSSINGRTRYTTLANLCSNAKDLGMDKQARASRSRLSACLCAACVCVCAVCSRSCGVAFSQLRCACVPVCVFCLCSCVALKPPHTPRMDTLDPHFSSSHAAGRHAPPLPASSSRPPQRHASEQTTKTNQTTRADAGRGHARAHVGRRHRRACARPRHQGCACACACACACCVMFKPRTHAAPQHTSRRPPILMDDAPPFPHAHTHTHTTR